MPTATTATRAPLEGTLEALFIHQVRSRLLGRAVKFAPLEKGCPDRLVLLPGGRMYLVELKRAKKDGGRLEPRQQVWHERAAVLGIKVHVLYGAEGILAWVKERAERWDAETVSNPEAMEMRCRGYVAGGKQCRKKTTHTSGYCTSHRSQH